MTTPGTREARIRLCSLRIRYRKAWQSQADSNTLAALLMAIESVNQSLNGHCIEPEPCLQQTAAVMKEEQRMASESLKLTGKLRYNAVRSDRI
ncbi:hypothetical protein ACQV2E_20805 [Pantoea allii]|uniref:hypothetical protein n=1 Tax=Pantoea allii TaxID=574096 RepID=UPI001FC9706D|nr:hypothetical protein [Pantoea allii]